MTILDERGRQSEGSSMTDDGEARRRAERRAFIKAQHPDAGGDPDRFMQGLARFDTPQRPVPNPDRPGVYRSRRPDRMVRHTIRDLRRKLSGQPIRRLK